jgi:TolB-like protein/tetratricopeptide (TPR) repeat protein
LTDTPTEAGGEGTWAKLRRRKVVQWGVAYAAGAWGLLQGIAYVRDTFDWPRQIQQFGTLALLIGLPIVLVIAWYHGDRGQQRLSGPELTILTLLLLAGGGIFWLYQRSEDTLLTAASPVGAGADATDSRPSIAVLPFVNLSDDRENEYFSDGLAEQLLNDLARVEGLAVVGRTSSFAFKGRDVDLRVIGRELGVAHILEGSVRKAGNRVRVSAKLVSAADGFNIWSASYDRELTDVFAIQEQIATQVIDALRVSLLGSVAQRLQGRPTRNVTAYDAYLRGMQQLARASWVSLPQAADEFRRALALDPQYTLAHVGLAEAYVTLAYTGAVTPDEALHVAGPAIQRALAIDPELPDAHAVRGWIENSRGDSASAERSYRRGLQEAGSLGFAPVHYGTFLLSHMRYAEARDMLLPAIERDPLSPQLLFVLAYAYDGVRDHAAALATLKRASQLDPNNPTSVWSRAVIQYWSLGGIDRALLEFAEARRIDPHDPEIPALTALAWLDLGDPVRAASWVDAAMTLAPEQALARRAAVALALFRGDAARAATIGRVAVEEALPGRFESRLAFLRALRLEPNVDLARLQDRYEEFYPGLAEGRSVLELSGFWMVLMPREYALAEIDLAAILIESAQALLTDAWAFVERSPPTGIFGGGAMAASIHALRGEAERAITALRTAIAAGWIENWWWVLRYDPSLASLRKMQEFQAIVAGIEAKTAAARAKVVTRESSVATPPSD